MAVIIKPPSKCAASRPIFPRERFTRITLLSLHKKTVNNQLINHEVSPCAVAKNNRQIFLTHVVCYAMIPKNNLFRRIAAEELSKLR